jgi:hypothetical protein
MSEHEQRPSEDEQAERNETVEDLDVPEEQLDDVAGGALSHKRGIKEN